MNGFNAKYKNENGEYEITFYSRTRKMIKTVEKVCCAIMDGKVKGPEDVVPVRHGHWVWDKRFADYTCSVCHNWDLRTPNYCSNCGATMDEEVQE